MRLRSRFLLVGFGMVVFVLITPVVVLYALGYKFDLEAKQIQKTGSLIVKTDPAGANAYIDDVLQARKTNSTIRFLLPGDYNIKVSKEGYQSWTKRLNIRSSLVTWANHEREYVTLFYETPQVKSEKRISLAAISLRENEAVVVENEQIYKYNPDRDNLERISSSIPVFNPGTVLPAQNVLFPYLRFASAKTFTPTQIASAKQLEANDTYSALLMGTDLMWVRDNFQTAIASNVSGFSLENEHLWYVQGNILKHANLNLGLVEDITTFNYSPLTSKIIRGSAHVMLILDGTLYALNDELEEVQRGVNYAYWDNDSERLVIANTNEVVLFDPSSFKQDLLIRSSTPITQPVINKASGYLFFLNENKLKAIELDGRDHRNVYTILEEPAESYLVSRDGELVTIFTQTSLASYQIR